MQVFPVRALAPTSSSLVPAVPWCHPPPLLWCQLHAFFHGPLAATREPPHPPCNDGRSTCHTPLQTDRCFIAASAPLYLHQPVIGVDCTKHCTNLFKIAPLHYQSQIGWFILHAERITTVFCHKLCKISPTYFQILNGYQNWTKYPIHQLLSLLMIICINYIQSEG